MIKHAHQLKFRQADMILQSIVFWPTLMMIIVPPFFLIGLFHLGLLQLLSALIGGVLLKSSIRLIYLGSSTLYLMVWVGFFKFILPDLHLSSDFEPLLFILFFIPAIIGGGWYYFFTKKEAFQIHQEASKLV